MRFMGLCTLFAFTAVASLAQAQKSDLTYIDPNKLPAPYATPSAENGSSMVSRPKDAKLTAPAGFRVELYAKSLSNPRWCAPAPNGDVFVAEAGAGRVVVLRENSQTKTAFAINVFASDLDYPFGILFHGEWVYIGCRTQVLRYRYTPGQTRAGEKPEVVLKDLPGDGHRTRNLLFDARTGKMYITIGSSSDHNEEKDSLRATICEFNPDGTGFQVFASGIRNACGMGLNPKGGELWTVVNERDALGDDLVPDYATSVSKGSNFGFPYYYIGKYHDPRLPEKPEIRAKSVTPDVLLTSHVASLGMTFYTGKQFPKEYQGDLFVAQHGSGNREKRVGFNIVHVPFRNGKPVGGFREFVGGWMLGEDDRRVWGRPVGVFQAKDGSLLVTDDGGNCLWRISYEK
jgi:glucose/arabinose dehydrogenase